jgi:hypothetical protein
MHYLFTYTTHVSVSYLLSHANINAVKYGLLSQAVHFNIQIQSAEFLTSFSLKYSLPGCASIGFVQSCVQYRAIVMQWQCVGQ